MPAPAPGSSAPNSSDPVGPEPPSPAEIGAQLARSQYGRWAFATSAAISVSYAAHGIWQGLAGDHAQHAAVLTLVYMGLAFVSLALLAALRRQKPGLLRSAWFEAMEHGLQVAGLMCAGAILLVADAPEMVRSFGLAWSPEPMERLMLAAGALTIIGQVVQASLPLWGAKLLSTVMLAAGYFLVMLLIYGVEINGLGAMGVILVLMGSSLLFKSAATCMKDWVLGPLGLARADVVVFTVFVLLCLPPTFGIARRFEGADSLFVPTAAALVSSVSISVAAIATWHYALAAFGGPVLRSLVGVAGGSGRGGPGNADEQTDRQGNGFLARVVHELKTPIGSVLGFAELMAIDKREPLTPRQRLNLDKVEDAAQHLKSLVDDLLDFSSAELGKLKIKPEPVPLQALLRKTVEMLGPQAESRQIALQLLDFDERLTVWGDERRLQQIFLNLLSNAIKYGRSGGRAWVSVARLPVPVADSIAPGVLVTVHDDGPGIPDHLLPHLFEPFNRLGREGGIAPGAGLGLAISRALASRMGGSLEVASTEGAGTQVTVRLQAGEEAAASGQTLDAGLSSRAGAEALRLPEALRDPERLPPVRP